MIKFSELLKEIKILPSTKVFANKENFIIFIEEFYKCVSEARRVMIPHYENNDFTNLSDKIIHIFNPMEPYIEAFGGSWIYFVEWLKGIDNEELPINSSGSFYVALKQDAADQMYGINDENGYLEEDELYALVDEAAENII